MDGWVSVGRWQIDGERNGQWKVGRSEGRQMGVG